MAILVLNDVILRATGPPKDLTTASGAPRRKGVFTGQSLLRNRTLHWRYNRT